MTNFNHTSDEVEELGFISKEKLLQYVTEEDIYELVFKFKPVEFEYITSPLRVDNNPGCWFEVDVTTGKLMFRDFGDGNKPLDCFDLVQRYFKLPNFYKTLDFVKTALIDGKGVKHDIKHVKARPKRILAQKTRVKILVKTRPFNDADRKFWQQYGITKKQLIDDKVFPISLFKMIGTKKGDISIKPRKVTYAYTEFDKDMKKIYQPYQKGKYKFATNCDQNAVGGLKKLVPFGRQLVITKSYKDYRVLKNQGLNSVWFQNEGQIPSLDIVLNLANRFDNVIIFFDNDETGINAAIKVVNLINENIPGKARRICLDTKLAQFRIKDPADLIKKRGRKALTDFLKFQQLL
jgi:RNA recognition motif-containing protein